MATNNTISTSVNTSIMEVAQQAGQELTEVINDTGLDLLFAMGVEAPEGGRYVDLMESTPVRGEDEEGLITVCVGILSPVTGTKAEGSLRSLEEKEEMEEDTFRFPLLPFGDIFVNPSKREAWANIAIAAVKTPNEDWKRVEAPVTYTLKTDLPWEVAESLMALFGELGAKSAAHQLHLTVGNFRQGARKQWEKADSKPTQIMYGDFVSLSVVKVGEEGWLSVRKAPASQRAVDAYVCAIGVAFEAHQAVNHDSLRGLTEEALVHRAMMGGGTTTVSTSVLPAQKPRVRRVTVAIPTTTPRGASVKDAFGADIVDED